MADINPITGQVDQAGITSLPAANTTVANPLVSNEINQAYQNLFGRAADPEGAAYWASTGLTGDALTQAMIGGARGADIGTYYKTGDLDISPDITASDIRSYVTQNINDPYAIFSSAEKFKVDPATIAAAAGFSPEDTAGFLNKYNLARQVAQEYQDIGRGLTGQEAADKEGFNYWFDQLNRGLITPDQFEKTFLTSALETVGKGGAGEDVAAKTFVESLSKGYGGTDVTGIVNPLEVYEEFMQRGLTPEQIVEKNPQMTVQQINDYFTKVPELYTQNVNKTLEDIFGKDIVSSERFASLYTPEQKETLVNKLLTGEASREDIAKSFQESALNKQQEALRIANIYSQAFGGSEEDSKALFAKLTGGTYSGEGKVDDAVYSEAKKAFDQALKSESDANTGIASLVKKAAKQEGAENNPFFQKNPDALLVYGDLKQRSDDPFAKYGEINNAPIYDAKAIDKFMETLSGDDDIDSVSGFAHRDTRRMGIDPGGIIDGGSAFIKRGAAVFGLEKVPEFGSEGESTGKFTISGDVNAAAQKAGIDPSKFQDKYKTVKTTDEYGNPYEYQTLDKTAAEQIYDAINQKMDDLYVIGNVNPDNPSDKSENNFMYTAYKRTDDGKLIPVNEPTYYTGAINPDVYKKKGILGGGFLGDFAQGIASIPFIAELAALTIPGAAAWYPAMKAGQTAAYTTNLGDIAKTGGIAALGQYGAQYVSPYISETLGTGPLATNLATGATLGAGAAGIMGEDIGKGAITGLTGAALGYGTEQLLPKAGLQLATDLGIEPKYQSLFANTLARLTPTILTGGKIDPTKVLMSYAANQAAKEIKSAAKQQVRGTA